MTLNSRRKQQASIVLWMKMNVILQLKIEELFVYYLLGVRGLLLCLRTGRVRGSNEKPSFRLSSTEGAT